MQMHPPELSNIHDHQLDITDTTGVCACLNWFNPAAFELDIATVNHE
jgi:hypothetical protein